jgi:hypothetical protein
MNTLLNTIIILLLLAFPTISLYNGWLAANLKSRERIRAFNSRHGRHYHSSTRPHHHPKKLHVG